MRSKASGYYLRISYTFTMMISAEVLKQILESRGISMRGVFHVGAHLCEELEVYMRVFGLRPDDVVWVDANADLIKKNKENRVPNCYVAALDETEREVEFKITNNGQSSSLLELGTHAQSYPHIVVTERRVVKTQTLPNFIAQNGIDMSKYNVWNFDIQGSELHVLRGGAEFLKYADCIYTEVNTGEVYKGCGQLQELDDFLKEHGFTRVAQNIVSANWGDAVYLRQ